MSELFDPRTTNPFLVYSDEVQGENLPNREAYTEQLLEALKDDGQEAMQRAAHTLFPWFTNAKRLSRDIESCWKLLRISNEMQRTLKEGNVGKGRMEELGFRFVTRLYKYADGSGKPQEALVEDVPLFCFPLKGRNYVKFIKEGIGCYPQFPESIMLSETGGGAYELQVSTTVYDTEGEKALSLDLLEHLSKTYDALCTLHFHCLLTGSFNGHEIRYTRSNLSLLWWLLYDRTRKGRIDVCPACGKPFFADKERGMQRKFCSDQCRDFFRNHRDKIGEKGHLSREERNALGNEIRRGRPKGSKNKQKD